MSPDCLTHGQKQKASYGLLIFTIVFHFNLLKEEVLNYCTFSLGTTSLDTFVHAVSFSVLC